MIEPNSLLPPRFLFRFAAPCLYSDTVVKPRAGHWSEKGLALGPKFRLPCWTIFEGVEPWAELRAAWSEQGLALALRVSGKRQPVRSDENRPWHSDGLQLWIDTRATHDVHRATRFCHQFLALPGGGPRQSEATIEQFFINRAKDNARRAVPSELAVRGESRVDGYVLEVFLSATALGGFDPAEHPRLGFQYAVMDFELGEQTFNCPVGFPFREDPSLWGQLDLVR